MGMRNNSENAGFFLNEIFLPLLFHNRIFFQESYHLLGQRASKKKSCYFTIKRGEGKTEKGEIRRPKFKENLVCEARGAGNRAADT